MSHKSVSKTWQLDRGKKKLKGERKKGKKIK